MSKITENGSFWAQYKLAKKNATDGNVGPEKSNQNLVEWKRPPRTFEFDSKSKRKKQPYFKGIFEAASAAVDEDEEDIDFVLEEERNTKF